MFHVEHFAFPVELVCVREATGASLRSVVYAAGPELCPRLAES